MDKNLWEPGGRYHDTNLRDYESYQQEEQQRLQFQHDFAQSALKSGVLVNGGAIVALFTFVGHDKAVISSECLWWSFASFAAGLFFSLGAYVCAFVSQGQLMNWAAAKAMESRGAIADIPLDPAAEANQRSYATWGNRFVWGGLLSSLAGLAGFAGGAAMALAGFS